MTGQRISGKWDYNFRNSIRSDVINKTFQQNQQQQHQECAQNSAVDQMKNIYNCIGFRDTTPNYTRRTSKRLKQPSDTLTILTLKEWHGHDDSVAGANPQPIVDSHKATDADERESHVTSTWRKMEKISNCQKGSKKRQKYEADQIVHSPKSAPVTVIIRNELLWNVYTWSTPLKAFNTVAVGQPGFPGHPLANQAIHLDWLLLVIANVNARIWLYDGWHAGGAITTCSFPT